MIPKWARVGKNCIIPPSVDIQSHADSILDIGNNVVMGRYVFIINHYHDLSLNGDIHKESASVLMIEDNVFIGLKAIILPQVTVIGRNAIIGAGSVLSKNVGANEIWAGNPATKIGVRKWYQKLYIWFG